MHHWFCLKSLPKYKNIFIVANNYKNLHRKVLNLLFILTS